MTVFSNAVRLQLWRGIVRLWSSRREALSNLLKTDLQAAVNAADSWADSTAASYNTALPAPFRTNTTPASSSAFWIGVVLVRNGAEAIRSILGEVD